MKYKLFSIILFVFNIVKGQNGPYYFSFQIDSILKADSTAFKFQTAAWNYANIGSYKMALEVKDRQFPNAKPSVPTQEQTNELKNYKHVNAKTEILKQADRSRIVIINEAHHISLHRVFVTELLPDLHSLGYSFIGMETLNDQDTDLNQRKYPVLNSGFYSKEPCFGNLIREALQLGYTVFPYEQKYSDSLQKAMGREKAEAVNIKKLMDKNPNAKFIIYCGYDHAVEDTIKNFMGLPMAGQIKKLTGEDPFTIDQTALTEYYLVGNRYRKLIAEKEDVLLIDSSNNYFNRALGQKVVDCNLYHPNTTYFLNRPIWMKRKNTAFIVLKKEIKIAYPCLIKVYLANEDPQYAVPVDVVEVLSAKEEKASVIIKHQKQIAVIENIKGERQIIKISKSGRSKLK